MRRGIAVPAAIGVLATAGWLLLAFTGASATPSWRAAWLMGAAVPMGALPLVLGAEALGVTGPWALLPVLRRLLLLMPLVALLALPFLLHPDFPPAPALAWRAPGFSSVRSVLVLVPLSLLAWVFSRAPAEKPRRRLAVFGLVAHVFLASVGAIDWLLALQPGLASSSVAPLMIGAQVATAACAACLVGAVRGDGPVEEVGCVGTWVAVTAAAWAFLHFTQYLVVWSSNLPGEVEWYLARIAGLGAPAVWFAAAAMAIGIAILPTPVGRMPAVLASVAAMLLVVHAVEAFWLVTPAYRGRFTLALTDALALLAVGGLATALLLAVLSPARRAEAGHAG